jgi:hypothetical protein
MGRARKPTPTHLNTCYPVFASVKLPFGRVRNPVHTREAMRCSTDHLFRFSQTFRTAGIYDRFGPKPAIQLQQQATLAYDRFPRPSLCIFSARLPNSRSSPFGPI